MEYDTRGDDSKEYRLRRYDSIVAFHALKEKKQDMKKAPKNYYEESAESLLEDILARRDDSYEI